jgi:uncharacterized protein YbcI
VINSLPCSGNTVAFVTQQLHKELARFFKKSYGKEPDNITIEIKNDFVLCFFENFMSKAEELIAQSHPENIGKKRFLTLIFALMS